MDCFQAIQIGVGLRISAAWRLMTIDRGLSFIIDKIFGPFWPPTKERTDDQ